MNFFRYCTIAEMYGVTFVSMVLSGLCLFAIAFVFQGLALHAIAKREGYQKSWMAFVPFFNTYYIGVCSQKNNFYNISIKKIAIVAAVLDAVLVLLHLFAFIVRYAVLERGGYIIYMPSDYFSTGTILREPKLASNLPAELEWAGWVFNHFNEYVISLIDIAFVLLSIVLLTCFFRTYACRKYIVFTITSILTWAIFPILPSILFFVVRNNRGMEYGNYLAVKRAHDYQIYQQQQQFYRNQNNNPYNNSYNNPNNNPNNPYSNRSNQFSADDRHDPFSSDNNSSNRKDNDNPFDEFD